MGEEVDILGSLAPFYPDGVSVGDIEKVKALHDVFHIIPAIKRYIFHIISLYVGKYFTFSKFVSVNHQDYRKSVVTISL